jgi:hypothetical protein
MVATVARLQLIAILTFEKRRFSDDKLQGAHPGGHVITIDGNELQTWVDVVSQRWKGFIYAYPQVLTLPCDIRETQTVALLLQHIVAVELRYAQRLASVEETPYDAIPFDSAESIYHTHDLAMSVLSGVADRADSFWEEWTQFATRSAGTIELPRRTVFVHLFMHSVRHYAQLATLVRQHG